MFEDSVTMSRALTSLTLCFHIIFATLGVGIPLMISIAEFIGIKKKDPHYILLARRWTRGFVIIVAIGVVTGTAIGLQLSLLWPSFMQIAGNVISLPMFMETFAFFFEAIFLGAYLYTWDRFRKPIYHWLLSIPVVIGSTMSAVFITTVNAFMNAPQGFELVGRTITSIDPIAAILNPATPTKVFHVVSSAYLTSAAVLAAITAFHILKKKTGAYHKKALTLTAVATMTFAILNSISGDVSAKYLANNQPEKLAAYEWHFETEENADLIFMGTLNESGEIENAIRFPGFLSFLAHGDFNSEVTGLNEFDEELTPPLWIHYLFDGMVTLGMYLLAVSGMYLICLRIRRWNEKNSFLLWLLVCAGPAALIAVEFGWILAEVGRQPWILRGYMKVAEAATTSPHVGSMFLLFLVLYVVLAIIAINVLRKLFKHNPVELELEERYPDLAGKDGY